MFSLIITIISIALVAALALATLYYGGAAFNKGSADAEASKIMLQGQQLLGAADMYFAEHNVWPTRQQLLDGNYLKAIPSAAAGVGEAHAAPVEWTMPIAGQPVFLLAGSTAQDACAAVNLKGSLGQRGILRTAYSSLNAQCYGADGTYKVLFKKFATATSLDDATDGVVDIPASEVTTGPVPTDSSDPAWSTPPVVSVGGGSGGGGGGGGDGSGDGGDGGGTTPPGGGTGAVWLSDNFDGADGLSGHGRSAVMGGVWESPYFLTTGYTDCVPEIRGNTLRSAGWSCYNDVYGHMLWNTQAAPSGDVEMTITFDIVDPYMGWIELNMFASSDTRNDDTASNFAFMQMSFYSGNGAMELGDWWNVTSYANTAHTTAPQTYSVRLKVTGTLVEGFVNGEKVHEQTIPSALPAGYVGFGMGHGGAWDSFAPVHITSIQVR